MIDEMVYKIKRCIKTLPRKIKYFFQERIYGFSDDETHNLSHEFAKWVVPRLKRFKELNNGYPPELNEDEWDEILDEMIDGFSIAASHDWWGVDIEDRDERIKKDKENLEKIDRAVDLWSHYFHDLWW